MPERSLGLSWLSPHRAAGRPVVALNGNKVAAWAFDTNNVLSWEHQAGYSAWLQFTHLPGGPLFMGTISPSSADGYVSTADFQVRLQLLCSFMLPSTCPVHPYDVIHNCHLDVWLCPQGWSCLPYTP